MTPTPTARYRRVCPRVWRDEKFATLSPVQKLVFLYAITAQSNRVGLFRFSPAMACEDLGLPIDEFREAFQAVRQSFGWGWDEANRVLFLPNWWRYNPPENPNTLKGAFADLAELPRTSLSERFAQVTTPLIERFKVPLPEGFGNHTPNVPGGLAKPYPQPCPNQEQEQEQEQECVPPSATHTPGTKSPRKKSAEPTKSTGHHAEAVAAFCDAWQAKYGETYSFQDGKDGAAVKWMLAEVGGDVNRWREIVARFLADGDKFYREGRHTLGMLRAQFNRWKTAGVPSPADRHPGYDVLPGEAKSIAIAPPMRLPTPSANGKAVRA